MPVSGVKAVLIQRLEEHHSLSLLRSPATPPPSAKKSKYFTDNDVPLKGKAKVAAPKSTTNSPPKSPSKKKSQLATPVTPEHQGSGAVNTPAKRKAAPPTTVTPSPRKRSKSAPGSSPRKRSKIAPGSRAPPENWERTYALVAELRADRTAPVDTDGGSALPETHLGPRVQRFQILTALMLSSQTKDAVVGAAMRRLQRRGLTVERIHAMEDDALNDVIGKVGFHNNKTKYLKQTAALILARYDGDIPPTAEEMMTLPGVGPKMAYLVEYHAFGTVTGIGVDVHMHRIFNALKWVESKTPEQTRVQLEGWLPKRHWGTINELWVGFGQEVQQQKEKTLRKALACSAPREALGLVQMLQLDVQKEGRRFGLEEDIRRVLEG